MMIKKYKWQLLFSSLMVLSPAAVGAIMWNKLPVLMATHWGFNGEADGWGTRAFAVFGLPLILLAIHWLCVLITLKDPRNKKQNRKVVSVVLWIIPFVSVFVSGIVYSLAMGEVLSMYRLLPLLLGALFAVVGNYMPKCKQNTTIGIKLRWTLISEENWNATHRLAGKVWVAGGFVMLLVTAFPMSLAIGGILVVTAVMVIVPTVFSYMMHRAEVARGTVSKDAKIPMTKNGKRTVVVSVAAAAVLLVLVAVLMFTGNIHVTCDDTALMVKASFYRDLTVPLEDIMSVGFAEEFDVGMRAFGFGSARLQMGSFENEEYGSYTLYGYTGSDAYVVITLRDRTLVVSGKTTEETKAVFDMLVEHIA